MRTTASRLPALVCALALPLCALAIWPVAEMGVMDDWSYIRTVQTLAHTGHIVYNGWSASIVGWQLYLGALFARLFGSSFTVIRLSMLLVAMVTAYLTQRTLVRAGIREWNATIGTLALVLSPLFLSVTFSFMTDVSGLFCIVLCLYACLRALQAGTDRAAMAWICFAAISNALGGTVRQIAWLGFLVMVPSTLWLLRRRPRFLFVGSLLYVFCVAIIFASLHWFHQQPYSVPEPLVRDHVTLKSFFVLGRNLVQAALETALLLLPVLVMFLPSFPRGNRRATVLLVGAIAICILFGLLMVHFPRMSILLAPFLRNSITIHGFMDAKPFHGERPVILSPGVRLLLTTLVVVSTVSFFAFLLTRRTKLSSGSSAVGPVQPSWYSLGVVLVPFTLAYFALLLPRTATNELFDRYLLPVMMFAIIVVLRIYQEQIQPRIPAATLGRVWYCGGPRFVCPASRSCRSRQRASFQWRASHRLRRRLRIQQPDSDRSRTVHQRSKDPHPARRLLSPIHQKIVWSLCPDLRGQLSRAFTALRHGLRSNRLPRRGRFCSCYLSNMARLSHEHDLHRERRTPARHRAREHAHPA